MARPKLLLRVKQNKLSQQISKIIESIDFNVEYLTPTQDLEQLQTSNADLFLLEVNESDREAIQTLLNSNLHFYRDFIFISNGQPISPLDEMMRQGAGYHLRQPIDLKQLKEVLQDYFSELLNNHKGVETIQASNIDQFGLLTGSSLVMRKLYRTIRRVASTESNVLIQGESGAGKELVAQTIHSQSKRNLNPFIAVNCGALSPELIDSELFGHIKGAFTGALKDHKGLFEQAEGGTLFLDEVTEMPLEQQVKLLRVLENGEYRPVGSQKTMLANVRIIAATNRNPLQAIQDEIFREDLYFRLCQFPLQVPPLRARGKDVTELAKHFLAYRCSEEKVAKSITEQALEKIANYNWPGNVRELRHTVERAFILAEAIIDVDHLIFEADKSQDDISDIIPSGLTLEELEKIAIHKALDENKGNKTEAAQQLGISVKTLYNKLEKYAEMK
ncbi:sigma-54 dependent transcriptional regulator [Catenovulum sp. 2E275]|uniref:sigma-54 interaction domain-containing protein n=1 Tax=Catenovulum sp. 2E275 TaxID=2980497 RepID=UPI0021D0D4D9|nr:sigma-54 dependent transcriptional regulator [Catenovulum sp. 2E275]MCU4674379.1 sigma-54 dependent transcriptional regulator [Catenovulum sp. 2E275]